MKALADDSIHNGIAQSSPDDVVDQPGVFGDAMSAPGLALSVLLTEGRAHHQKGEIERALFLCQVILAEKPDHLGALDLLGTLALHRKSYVLCVDSCDKAIRMSSRDPTLFVKKASALQSLQRYDAALASYDCALAIQPNAMDTWFSRGLLLQSMDRNADALISYDHTLAIKPDYAEALSNRGGVLLALNRCEEGLASYDQALAIKPHLAGLHLNHGNALQRLNRYEDALDSYDQALAIKPDSVEALSSRGNALLGLNRYAAALASYSYALAIDPGHVSANWNDSLCQLLVGNFGIGWRKFEWRWRTKQLKKAVRHFKQPVWLGRESLSGKTILLHAEQGFGDTLQFCRYVKHVASLGATVLLEVQPQTKSILLALPGVSKMFVKGDVLPDFDFHTPLMSLPLAHQTDLSNLPADIPYLFCDDAYVEKWERRLGEKTLPRVGVVWSGSVAHINDQNRSIPLIQFEAELPNNVDLFCLQKELRDADRALLDRRQDIRYFTDEINDFADTAALIELMDVVITVDTAVAHLAGAMGKQVWILLPFTPDWRWLRDRDDSPWYPTARLFRQPAIGDWPHVMKQVVRLLRDLD